MFPKKMKQYGKKETPDGKPQKKTSGPKMKSLAKKKAQFAGGIID